MNVGEDKRFPKVGIVVLNYRNYEDTIRCLTSLARVTYPNHEIIVVDNDSQNNSLEHVRRFLAGQSVAIALIGETEIEGSGQLAERVILLQSSRNGGYAAGNNLGIRIALERKADYVLILNSDTEVVADFLEPLVSYAEAHPPVGSVGPKVLNRDGSISRACARRRPCPWAYFFYFGLGGLLAPNNRWARRYYYLGEYAFDHPREVDLLSGCCMLLRSDSIRRVGLLDENTFLLQEEVILHEKFRKAGLTSAVVPASTIIHKHGGARSTEPSQVTQQAKRESIAYYLSEYRHLNRWVVFLILASISLPNQLLRRIKGRRARHD